MAEVKRLKEQLERLGVKISGWGRSEIRELHNIILPDEEVYEIVNGIYEGGFALLAATNIRVILIDKKPLNYLTVEDLRFDMINEIDYSHRLLGAQITISTGSKTLKFRSYNQKRLRKAINHVQTLMAESKSKMNEHQQDQSQHLVNINQQLQAYLFAQYQHQQNLTQQLEEAKKTGTVQDLQNVAPIVPTAELSDYLYAKSLLRENGHPELTGNIASPPAVQQTSPPATSSLIDTNDLIQAGKKEIFGRRQASNAQQPSMSIVVNPLKVAYAKLPLALRNRKFGRPSFHAHSGAVGSGPAIPSPFYEAA